MFKKILYSTTAKLTIATLYICVFYEGYVQFLNVYFGYLGFGIKTEQQSNMLLLIFSFLVALLPVFFFKGVKKISSFFCIFIYFILYVPIIVTFFLNSKTDLDNVIFLDFSFLFGMSILFLSDRINVKKNFSLPSKIDIFKIVLFFCFVFIAYVAIKYRSNLRFVSFENVYEQRLGNDSLGDDIFTAYILVWLSNILIPICFVYGIYSKSKIYVIAGILGSVIIYMATAAKSVLLFPLIIYLLYRLLLRRNLNLSFILIGLSLVLILSLSLIDPGFSMFKALVWMRTIGNGGLLTNYYQNFFENHPVTYYSHINIVNFFTNSYPYDKSLGQTVGAEYWSEENNVNANFWATDGFAALGNYGVIFSSILLFFVFTVFNKVCNNYDKLFLILIFIPYINSLLNTSIFTSLVTGGGLITIFILSFSSAKNNKFIHKKDNK